MGALYQTLQQVPPVGCFQIEGDASFVGGIGPPEQALLRMYVVLVEGADVTGGAASGGLHLDDVSAQVRQDLSAEETSLAGQV